MKKYLKIKKSNIGTFGTGGTHSIKFLLFMSISYSGIRAQNIKNRTNGGRIALILY